MGYVKDLADRQSSIKDLLERVQGDTIAVIDKKLEQLTFNEIKLLMKYFDCEVENLQKKIYQYFNIKLTKRMA